MDRKRNLGDTSASTKSQREVLPLQPWLFILLAKYTNRRFYSCLDYAYNDSYKIFVYTTNLKAVPFMIKNFTSLSDIFSIFSLAGPIKLMVHLNITKGIG